MSEQSLIYYSPFRAVHPHSMIFRETQVTEIPGPIFENLDPYLLNVAKSVCKIRIDTYDRVYIGSGFF